MNRIFNFGSRAAQRPGGADPLSHDVELGDWHHAGEEQAGVGPVGEESTRMAAGPQSTSIYPQIPAHEGSTTAHHQRSTKRGREEDSEARSLRLVVAPETLLQQRAREEVEATVRKTIEDEHQRERQQMQKKFDDQMAAFQEKMDKMNQYTTATMANMKTKLEEALRYETKAQAESVSMAAELAKLRALHQEDNSTGSAPIERTAFDALLGKNRQLQDEIDALRKNQVGSRAPEHDLTPGIVNDDDGIMYIEEEENDGDADVESDDDEDDVEGGDVEMVASAGNSRQLIRAPSTRRQTTPIADVSDDDIGFLGSDVSMEPGEGAAKSSPAKGPTKHSLTNRAGRQIPAPTEFSRPIGGAGPQARTGGYSPNTAPILNQTKARANLRKGRNGGRDFRRMVENGREWYRGKGPEQGASAGNADERASGRNYRPTKRLNVFSVVNLRGTDLERKQLLGNVELLMNKAMDIENYDDIINTTLAEDTDAKNFAAGHGNPPVLMPLHPYFGKKFRTHPWNLHLEELFLEYYAEEMDVDLDVNEQDQIADMFRERLKRLRRHRRDMTKNLPGDQRRAREQERMEMGRRNTRRVNLFDTRRQICLESVKTPDGSDDEKWQLLLEMVLQLGSYGMSSDESEVDAKGYTRYNIRKRLWRNKAISERLEYIDRARNTTNGKGKRLPGNTLRERIRSTRGPASTRDPSIKCPKNFYSTGYLASLNNLQRRALREQSRMDLAELSS